MMMDFKDYYLHSHIRKNLLNWYPFKKNSKILEIRAENGAITKLLKEKLNYTQEIQDSEYDYILINQFTGTYQECLNELNHLKKYLTPNGVILLTAHNRKGLKNYAWIQNKQLKNTEHLLCQEDIKEILNTIQLPNYKILYPYPDHIFPDTIYSEDFVNTLPYKLPLTNYYENILHLFPEQEINTQLASLGLSGEYANSFLIEIQNNHHTISSIQDINYIKLSAYRRKEYQIATIIHNKETVEKIPLTKQAQNHITHMHQIPTNIGKIQYLQTYPTSGFQYKYINQESLEEKLLQSNKSEFLNIIKNFYKALKYNSYPSTNYHTKKFRELFTNDKTSTLFNVHNPGNIDLNFANIFQIDDTYWAIDYEWSFDIEIPVEFILWRAVFIFYLNNGFQDKVVDISEVYRYLGISETDCEVFEKWNIGFSDYYTDVFVPFKEYKKR